MSRHSQNPADLWAAVLALVAQANAATRAEPKKGAPHARVFKAIPLGKKGTCLEAATPLEAFSQIRSHVLRVIAGYKQPKGPLAAFLDDGEISFAFSGRHPSNEDERLAAVVIYTMFNPTFNPNAPATDDASPGEVEASASAISMDRLDAIADACT